MSDSGQYVQYVQHVEHEHSSDMIYSYSYAYSHESIYESTLYVSSSYGRSW